MSWARSRLDAEGVSLHLYGGFRDAPEEFEPRSFSAIGTGSMPSRHHQCCSLAERMDLPMILRQSGTMDSSLTFATECPGLCEARMMSIGGLAPAPQRRAPPRTNSRWSLSRRPHGLGMTA